ncbi:MAG: protein kinase, partial [Myxococcales bacterium]|nr:protein kinase [Myxococcales bacterium]
MACVTEAQVLGLLRNTLSPDQRTAVEQHLDRCPECLELVTLASQTSLVTGHLALGTGELPRATADATVLAAGTKVGRYEIVEPLGRGGMGMVYVARDDKLDRRVAIKLVNPSFAHHAHSQLGLLREAQAMARITQPNVLTVYDMGMFDDAVFLAAELVDGDTLDVWLAQPRRWRQIVEVFVQAARGLEAAHAAGLVHRDFKCQNIMLTGGGDPPGKVVVTDFGLAIGHEQDREHRGGAGSPAYMAPEQVGSHGALSPATDVYALGVVLFEML